ncbi:hypothetical protein Ciccas_000246 [Cichlidogyrus casuarinus]|uniref:Pecanex-like protein n=1 Tax=Cichlidogyrus casuarinus TaxID=1844966 RepID=A0ABD2QNH2_9PLAT
MHNNAPIKLPEQPPEKSQVTSEVDRNPRHLPLNLTSNAFGSVASIYEPIYDEIHENADETTKSVVPRSVKNPSSDSNSQDVPLTDMNAASILRIINKEDENRNEMLPSSSTEVESDIEPQLKRRYGFRRRPTLQPKQISNSAIVDVHHEQETGEDASTREESADQPSTSAAPNFQVPLVDQSSRLNAFARVILEDYLAHMMGVRNLYEAGLTVPSCLRQILCTSTSDSSELNAEESDFLMCLTTNAIQQAISQQSTAEVETARRRSSEHPVAIPTTPLLPHTPVPSSTDESSRCWALVETLPSRQSLPNPTTSTRPARPYVSFWDSSNPLALLRTRVNNARRSRPTYSLQIFPFWVRKFKLKIDRIDLHSLFDLDETIAELILSAISAVAVSILAMQLLATRAFNHIALIGFSFVVAGTQYGLVKSVQPDAASPEHGHNRIIVYSRSLYFCLLAGLFLFCDHLVPEQTHNPGPVHLDPHMAGFFVGSQLNTTRILQMLTHSDSSLMQIDQSNPVYAFLLTTQLHFTEVGISNAGMMNVSRTSWWWNADSYCARNCLLTSSVMNATRSTLYGVSINVFKLACVCKSLVFYLILLIPIWHLFGLLPQANTVVIYLLEQLDMHLFGGQGTVGLRSALFSVSRSILVSCAGALILQPSLKNENNNSEDHYCLVLYWGFMFAMAHLLSRLPSNIHLYELMVFGIDQKTGEARTTITGMRYVFLTCFRAVRAAARRFVQRVRGFAWSKHGGMAAGSAGKASEEAKNYIPLQILAKFNPSYLKGELTSLDNKDLKTSSLPNIGKHDHVDKPFLKRSQSSIVLSASVSRDKDVKTARNVEQPIIDPYEIGYARGESDNEIFNAQPKQPRRHLRYSSIDRPDTAWAMDASTDEGEEDADLDALFPAGVSIAELHRRNNDHDPLPPLVRASLLARMKSDLLILCPFWFLFGCGLHFTVRQVLHHSAMVDTRYSFEDCLIWSLVGLGFFLHYIWPRIRQVCCLFLIDSLSFFLATSMAIFCQGLAAYALCRRAVLERAPFSLGPKLIH